MKGQLDAAIPHLEKAVEANPAAFESQFNLARILAAKGKFGEAIPHLEQAVKRSGGREAASLVLLAGAYSELGRFGEAAATARRALAATAQSDTRMLETLRARIEYYESRAK